MQHLTSAVTLTFVPLPTDHATLPLVVWVIQKKKEFSL